MESMEPEDTLFSFLDALGIKTQTLRHSPVFTVTEAQALRAANGITMAGGHAKTLFLRDKKKRCALVVVDENRQTDLKSLAPKIGLGRVSFGSLDNLQKLLGVTPGSVTPFALVNAQTSEDNTPPIAVALDKSLMVQTTLWFHPLHNAATTAIAANDLIVFIRACGYEPLLIDMDMPEANPQV